MGHTGGKRASGSHHYAVPRDRLCRLRWSARHATPFCDRADATDKFVRIRWQVDEEHRQSVDRDAIAALFTNAAELKIEARILPVVRSRAQGISLETTIDRKIERWCEHADVEAGPLLARFELLETANAETIAARVLADLVESDALAQCSPDTAPAAGQAERTEADVELAMPDATVEVVDSIPASAPAAQLSWLDDDLFAA